MTTKTNTSAPTAPPPGDANTLGLDYTAEAARFAYTGPIIDIHTHVSTPEATRLYLDVAKTYGVVKTFSMTGFGNIAPTLDSLPPEDRDRLEFICVPDYGKREEPDAFTTQWLRDIERFREHGSRIIKFWAAPRGRELNEALILDSPIRKQGMKLAHDLGYRIFMTHVGDPDTWFATKYADASVYGTKPDQYKPLEAAMDQYDDVTWIGAHLSGSPEDLDFVQGLLDRHPNYVVDTSACKWMVRELSKHPQRFAEFCGHNRGHVLFGSDIVASTDWEMVDYDLFASRYWALRTLLETDYDGPSPIVDPDLHMVDPSVPEKSTAHLRGATLPAEELEWVYRKAAERVLGE